MDVVNKLMNKPPSRQTQLHPKKYTDEEIVELHHELDTHDHVISIDQLCRKYKTDASQGMSTEMAAEVYARDGPNCLSPPKMTPEYIKFLKCMYGGFAALLWVCAALCFVLYGVGILIEHEEEGIEWFGVIIVVICIVSGLFAYIQESKNSKVMESFKKMVPVIATVIRDGERVQLPSEEVVLGDLVEIRLGDKIPADIRIIDCNGLRVENSSITGESEPKTRTSHPTNNNPLESKNVAFFSSYAVAGDGKGIVIATGDNTMIGRLAGLTTHLSKVETPIAKEIRHFVHLIMFVAIICGIAFFMLSLMVEGNLIKAFTYLLGIVIANVPEVLLITVTTSLTLTAKKMADKNCLVKNLEAVETLGSTSVICSDKTGTLTQNKMSVSNIWFGNTRHNFPENTTLGVERDLLLEKPAFNIFVKNATLCLRAEFRHDTDDPQLMIEERKVIGDASETGEISIFPPITKFKEITGEK